MLELSNERIEKILHEETVKQEELATILRAVYNRYRHLYEKYFADIDALNDDEITKFKNYHEETLSLVKYYYMDIPLDICDLLNEFEDEYSANLLGADWHEFLFDLYKEFKEESEHKDKGEAYLKAEFKKQALAGFYDAMDTVFREGFNTGSQATNSMLSGIKGLLFGKEE